MADNTGKVVSLADDEHLNLLRLCVQHWNSARTKKDFSPDLSNHNFRGESLPKVNFSNANLKGADFSLANLRDADLRGANTDGTNFSGASLLGAKIDVDADGFFKDYGHWRKKELVDKKLRQIKDDSLAIPTRTPEVVGVHFDGLKLRATASSSDVSRRFTDALSQSELLSRELLATVNLDNVSRSVARALRAYIEAIEKYHVGDGQIAIGITGEALCEEIGAYMTTIEDILDEKAGTFRSLLLSHSILDRLMPDWQELKHQARNIRTPHVNIDELTEDIERIAASLSMSDDVDDELPRILRFLNAMAKSPSETSRDAVYAAIRALEDIFIEVFSVLLDAYNSTKSKIVKSAPAIVLAGIILALPKPALLGIVAKFSDQIGWISKAFEWIKNVGF